MEPRRLLPRLLRAALLAGLVAAGPGAFVGSEAPGRTPAHPPIPPARPPNPPGDATPVDRFRALLASSPAARNDQLARRSPEHQAYLRARLAEFDALPAAERELQLHLLTLRYHLLPLLRQPATNRADQLSLVPSTYRGLVADRLTAWDRLSPERQREWLDNEAVFATGLLTGTAGRPASRAEVEQLPLERRRELEQTLARWEATSERDRDRLTLQFESFLTLSEREKARVLTRLDSPQRHQANRLRQALEDLPPERRQQSYAGLERLAALSSADRQRFLKNAARWEAMSAEERAAWRRLRATLPPAPPAFPQPGTPALPPAPGDAAAPTP